MKKQKLLFALLVLMLTVLIQGGIATAEVDLSLSATPSSGTGNTSINPQDNTEAASIEAPTILDNFNRANGPIGANWTNRAGTFSVVNNAAQGGASALATFNGQTSNILEADVAVGAASVEYVGLVLGYAALNNNLFIKVQHQEASPGFDHFACYVGNNGGQGSWTGGGFKPLAENFSTAHMRVALSGTTVAISFTNIDGNTKPPQTYFCTDAPNTGGNGIGMASFVATNGRIDNFAADVPPVWTYCLKDVLYATEYRLNLEAGDVLRGQALYPSSDFPAPLTGHYNTNTGKLSFTIGYLTSNSSRHYFVSYPSLAGYSWGLLENSNFYDNPRAATLVFCPASSLAPAGGETGAPK
jgi:hypothetical protein